MYKDIQNNKTTYKVGKYTMTTHTIRNSKMAKILSLISESGIMEEVMKDFKETMSSQGFSMKSILLESLTPMGQEAFKLAYQIIDSEYYVLMGQEDPSISEKWFTHFIEFHDNIISELKKGSQNIFEHAIQEYGNDYVNNVFRQDSRSLEEMIDVVGEFYMEARKQQKQYESELKEKLHTQLQDVVATLKEIASDDMVNGFEVHTKGASFKIKTHNNEEGQECVCGHCGEGESLEELLQKIMGNIGLSNK